MHLYNSLSRRIERFAPHDRQEVTIYSCGPTVYARQHLGNMRPYVIVDTLRRTLQIFGYPSKQVINITDVGHLTDDGDHGEDKLEVAAGRQGARAEEIAARFTDLFQQDLARLRVSDPTIWARATDHIAEQLELIALLESRGHTYWTPDGIYFDSSTAPRTRQLSRLSDEGQVQLRVRGTDGKRRGADFALWKLSPPDARRQMEWESPWGRGFPGWHTECCAMANKYLGRRIDLHTGGVDHIPVHHENEILQAEAAFDVHPWVRTWLHSEWVMLGDAKMAKSEGAPPNLDDVVDAGIDPEAYRLLLLGSHYRSRIHFTWDSLRAAARRLERLRRGTAALKHRSPPGKSDPLPLWNEFCAALADDLNTPRALVLLHQLVNGDAGEGPAAHAAALRMDAVLGLGLDEATTRDPEVEAVAIPATVQDLVTQREAARAARDFAEADRLRAEIASLGYVVEDTPRGARLRHG